MQSICNLLSYFNTKIIINFAVYYKPTFSNFTHYLYGIYTHS